MYRRCLALLLFAGFLFGGNVKIIKDDFEGKSMVSIRLGDQTTFIESFANTRFTNLSIEGSPGENPIYSITVDLQQNGWLFIESGNSLSLKVDGVFLRLIGPGSSKTRGVINGSQIQEIATYFIKYDQLKLLSSAKNKVEYRLIGSNGTITGELKPKAIAAIQEFIATVPDGGWKLDGNTIVPISTPKVAEKIDSPAPTTDVTTEK